ncbi:phosphoadenosine phosphosulfate reductase family protein [Lachnospiraceae bacterium 54-11]
MYVKPELTILEEITEPLEQVDVKLMLQKNHSLIDNLAQETIKKIYNTYREYKKKIDVFYVAFSGGKDSVVVLDLVQRALPHNDFLVLFGDTGMEFSDTYKTAKNVKQKCESKDKRNTWQ